ncbi:hypothetical protein BH11CYA1_BH11CYA1_34910 [soil metagenome]
MQQSSPLYFDDNTSFADWLEEFEYFDSSCAGNFEPLPTVFAGDDVPLKMVSFQLGFPVGGSYDAGQLRRVKRYEFVAYRVERWAYTREQPAAFGFNGRLLDGVIVNDENTLLDLVIDDSIQLQCRQIEIRELSDLIEVNLPAVNKKSATLFFSDTVLPVPSNWIAWLKDTGVEPTWRRMHDVAILACDVNQDNYEGWFLQELTLIDSTIGGVMLKSLKAVEGGFFAELENWDQPVDEISNSSLWAKLSQVAASKSNVIVRCGNCLLTGGEWNQILLGQAETLSAIDFVERSAEGLDGWYSAWCDPEQDLPSRYVTPGGNAANYGRWPYICWDSNNQMRWHWKDDSNGP